MGIPFHVPITDQDTHASHRAGAPKAQRDCADETRLGCRTHKRAVYRRRRSERTLLYCTVQNHLATWLALHDDGPVVVFPASLSGSFIATSNAAFLTACFARARCADCGHDFLVAYSCKGRGVCPSCIARRMVEAATHFALHVIPRLPVRQRVLLVPKRLRYRGSEGEGVTFPHPYPCVST